MRVLNRCTKLADTASPCQCYHRARAESCPGIYLTDLVYIDVNTVTLPQLLLELSINDRLLSKLGIHLRQRQAEAWRSSLSLASIDDAPSHHRMSQRLLRSKPSRVSRSKWSKPEEFSSYAQYGWNVPHLAETEKHSSVCGVVRTSRHASACLCLKCIPGSR